MFPDTTLARVATSVGHVDRCSPGFLNPFRGNKRQIDANLGEPYDTPALTYPDFRAPGEAPEDAILGVLPPGRILDSLLSVDVPDTGPLVATCCVGWWKWGKDANIFRRSDTAETSGLVASMGPLPFSSGNVEWIMNATVAQ